MESQSAKELVEELKRHKLEASKLRNALDGLDREKETWFRKKEDISGKIKGLIGKIKESKLKRDSLTKEVKELKPKRDGLNKEINAKLKELGGLKKKKPAAKPSGFKEPSSKIKHHIEMLEFKIETDTTSFEKEKELMKKIKELKKTYNEAVAFEESNKKARHASDEIRKMRKEANEIHNLVQEKAKQSQSLHEEILNISNEIDKAKPEEEEAFRKFSELRQKFSEASFQLKQRLNAINDANIQLDKLSSERRERKRHEQESFLKSKEEEANQKLKSGKKLTTEDLLVFQGAGKE